jgi:ABC-2 type transport system permease protein
MTSKALEIARLYLKITFQDRSILLFAFLLPLLFTFLIGQTVRGGQGEAPDRWPLALVDEDGSASSLDLLRHLEADPALQVTVLDRSQALDSVAEGEQVAAVVVPAGFEAGLRDGRPLALAFYTGPEHPRLAQLARQAVLAAASQVSSSMEAGALVVAVARRLELFVRRPDLAPEDLHRKAVDQARDDWVQAPVRVESSQVTRLEDAQQVIPDGVSQSSPGMMVMFAMFFTIGGASVLIEEREEGTLRRLMVVPLRRATLIFGKFLGIYSAGLLQILVLVLAGALLFQVGWGQSPAALALMIASFSFAITALGMMMAALVRTSAQANALGTVVVLSLASLGGAWWPLEIVPGWMRTLGHLLPTAWAMDGFHDIITRGLGVEAVLPEAGILGAFGVVFLGVAIWRLRYE